jgi:hypothetical protein
VRVSKDEGESVLRPHPLRRIAAQPSWRNTCTRLPLRCSSTEPSARQKRAVWRVFASPIWSQLRQASASVWPMCWRALGLRHGRSDGGD